MKKTKMTSMSLALVLGVSLMAGSNPLPVTPAEQAGLDAETVLKTLMEGNDRFVAGKLTTVNIPDSVKEATKGQYPMAYVLSCVDSRVPVELVFDQAIGDIFVGRNAGNVDTMAQLGSMEFAAKVAGVKLILVLGHESCGAVKGACDHVKLGNLTQLLAEIEPAVSAVDGFSGNERSSGNKQFVGQVVHQNVRQTVKDIRYRSPVLAEMETAGSIRIVGAYYSLQTGKVSLVD